MTKKLTLTVDESTIEKAKIYAKQTGRSLSGLVENYLKTLVVEDLELEIEENISRLSGKIQLPENFDEDNALREYLEKKHF